MLTEFEQQLQRTIRSRLPAALRELVRVATGATDQAGILCGVRSAQPLRPEFQDRRVERVPGAVVGRRVVRLRCQVAFTFVPEVVTQPRATLLDWFDQVAYLLDADDLRDGSALVGEAPDPGFLIQRMTIESAELPLAIHAVNSEPLQLTLSADGWFWPVGATGEAGVAIGEIRIRGVVHPLTLAPAAPILVAGGPAVALTLSCDPRGTARVTAGGLAAAPFGNLAVRVEQHDGTVGNGTLTGGTAGSDGSRLLTLTAGSASVTYTPPPAPATEILVLAVENGAGASGLDVGRFPLIVRAAP